MRFCGAGSSETNRWRNCQTAGRELLFVFPSYSPPPMVAGRVCRNIDRIVWIFSELNEAGDCWQEFIA
jgi:hypothetical protein